MLTSKVGRMRREWSAGSAGSAGLAAWSPGSARAQHGTPDQIQFVVARILVMQKSNGVGAVAVVKTWNCMATIFVGLRGVLAMTQLPCFASLSLNLVVPGMGAATKFESPTPSMVRLMRIPLAGAVPEMLTSKPVIPASVALNGDLTAMRPPLLLRSSARPAPHCAANIIFPTLTAVPLKQTAVGVTDQPVSMSGPIMVMSREVQGEVEAAPAESLQSS